MPSTFQGKRSIDLGPPGLKLRCVLKDHHSGWINRLAWSRRGERLASACNDKTIGVWDPVNGRALGTCESHSDVVLAVDWAPDAHLLASASGDRSVRYWDPDNQVQLREFWDNENWVQAISFSPDGRYLATGSSSGHIIVRDRQTDKVSWRQHAGNVYDLAWINNARILASASEDGKVRLWEATDGTWLKDLTGHTGFVLCLSASPDGQFLASGSTDATIRVWQVPSGNIERVIESHTRSVRSLSFSVPFVTDQGHVSLLASKSEDDTVRLWRTDSFSRVADLREPASGAWFAGLAFHPELPVLATLGSKDRMIRVWDLDLTTLLSAPAAVSMVRYRKAKVVLLGRSGVGKTALSLALLDRPYAPTDSTHNRCVSTLSIDEIDNNNEIREVFIWDLAGQTGYEYIHQLHLHDVTVGLFVFDAGAEKGGFDDVRHWERALRQACQTGSRKEEPRKFLVAARADRGGPSISEGKIQAFSQGMRFLRYIETSARRGSGIEELRALIKENINWDSVVAIETTPLLMKLRYFVIQEKNRGGVLVSAADMLSEFCTQEECFETEEVRLCFHRALERLESTDWIRIMSFGDLVLLQPELLDSYAWAIVQAAQHEPLGLGCIAESDAFDIKFVPPEDRVEAEKDERLLVIATVEELIRHEIALREYDDDKGVQLVFPSQFQRERGDAPDVPGKAVRFRFEGAIGNIYATLVVRLSHSKYFSRLDMWKDAAIFKPDAGGEAGVLLNRLDEDKGIGEITLFFHPSTPGEKRTQFEEFVWAHLQRRAVEGSVTRQPVYSCPICSEALTDRQAKRALENALTETVCPACMRGKISLLFGGGALPRMSKAVVDMHRIADAERDRNANLAILKAKEEVDQYDVMVCYNHGDRAGVIRVVHELEKHGVRAWVDARDMPAFHPWQRAIEEVIRKSKAVAVFVGASGHGATQQLEMMAALDEYTRRCLPLGLVLLEDCPASYRPPLFFSQFHAVDFRVNPPDPILQLVAGITGVAPMFLRPDQAADLEDCGDREALS